MSEKPSSYIVCTHPRSGSSYFCQLLASTGKLGNPDEYFHESYLRCMGVTDTAGASVADYISSFQVQAASANGVVATKMFWFDLEPLIRAGLADRFGNFQFVFLQRKDKLAQAISIRRARETGLVRSDTGSAVAPARYDYADIRLRLTRLLIAERNWRTYFDKQAIKPLNCVYEDIQ